MAWPTEQPLVMERAPQPQRGMVPSELCWADAHKRRGYPGKAGRFPVGEKLYNYVQRGRNEFRVLQGRTYHQGKCLVWFSKVDVFGSQVKPYDIEKCASVIRFMFSRDASF